MASAWITMFATLLLAFVNGAKDVHTSPSVRVHTSTPVVALGSPVTASCVIRDDCPLIKGQAVHIVWHLNQLLIPSSSAAANESGRNIAAAGSPHFTDTSGYLTCCVSFFVSFFVYPCSVVCCICLTNLTKLETLSCQWDPGQDTHLPTQYPLYTEISDTYVMPPGEIYVKVVNALGQATSTPLLLEPMESAKVDPPKVPKVQAEPKRYGCLRLSWGLSEQQVWVTIVTLEVRLKTANSKQWSEEPVPVPRLMCQRPMEVCRLLHGTEYHIQIWVGYHQSPWSEWSNSNTAFLNGHFCFFSAPTGPLDSWMKVSREQRQKHLGVYLFWKPSKQFHANGKILSCVVSRQRQPMTKGQLCVTLDSHCVFQLARGAREVFLSAGNTGSIQKSELMYKQKVFCVLCQHPKHPILFDHIDRNQSSTLLSESIEPYNPYGISVYPRYKDGIGLPQTVEAYSRQKGESVNTNPYTLDFLLCPSFTVVTAELGKRRVVLRELNPSSSYKAFIMVGTGGGSLNGSEVTLKAEPMGWN
uniref:Uncharacterized protein n=1 Tax=Oncorhynchus kisutch TaxID=8019 RepID=A0A8C7FG76_ONCKI